MSRRQRIINPSLLVGAALSAPLTVGANMRFFFMSPRYSEDIDFDAPGMRVDILM
jgi:hypothetical protein